jgi:hypothetical protein
MAKTYKKRKSARKSRRVRRVKRGGNQDMAVITPNAWGKTMEKLFGL